MEQLTVYSASGHLRGLKQGRHAICRPLVPTQRTLRTVTTRDNCALYVKEQGTGRPVILIHGWPLQADTFDDLGFALAESGMHAIAYDRRGFGRSEQPVEGYEYDTLADDLAAVLEEYDAQDCTLIGFSMGGGEIIRYLSRHGGERVRDVVLISAVTSYLMRTGDNPDGVPQETFAKMAEGIKEDRPHFWADFFKDFYGVGLLTHGVSNEVLYWSNHIAMQGGLKATLDCATAFTTTDFRPEMKVFTMPTLLLHGTADRTVPIDPTARQSARAIAGSELIEYDGAPHGLLSTHKEELKRDVLRFLLENDGMERRSLSDVDANVG